MEYQHESGFNLEYAGSFTIEEPEERFMNPKMTRLRSWLVRSQFDESEVKLIFRPGIFIFSEVNFDDRDTGVYESRYVTTLLPLPADKAPDWTSPSVSVDRSMLRPLSGNDQDMMHHHFGSSHLVFESLLQSYVNFLNERSKFQLFHNEAYDVYSSFGESFEEFREVCIDYALLEKSERALKLSTQVDLELQHQVSDISHALVGQGENESDEALEKVEAFKSACRQLLNKAVSLHVLDVNVSDEASIRWTNYTDTLRQEADTICSRLDKHSTEFQKFSDTLIERFSEIEKETNQKAIDIETLEVPLSRTSMRILRVEKVWLPYWNIRSEKDSKFRERVFKAH